jgi:murein L,D-transpeptidase YafK
MSASNRSPIGRSQLICAVGILLLCAGCGYTDTQLVTGTADRVILLKSARTMTLMSGSKVIKVYKVAIGRSPVGPKTKVGDHKTPEGIYVIDAKKDPSRFHRAFHLSYPNQADIARARQLGVNPGGDIEIHGIENGLGWIGSLHRTFDWTDGCIAVTDAEIDEAWQMVPVGTVVEIRP